MILDVIECGLGLDDLLIQHGCPAAHLEVGSDILEFTIRIVQDIDLSSVDM